MALPHLAGDAGHQKQPDRAGQQEGDGPEPERGTQLAVIVVSVFGVEGHELPGVISAKDEGDMGRRRTLCKAGEGRELIGGPCPPIRLSLFVSSRRRHSQPFRLKKRPVPSDDITISTRESG